MVISSFRPGFAAFAAALLLGFRCAHAGPVVVNMDGTTDPDPTVVGWKATVTSSGQTVSPIWLPTPLDNGLFPNGKPFPKGGNQGMLNMIVQFSTLDPLVIHFDQQRSHDYGGEGTRADLDLGPLRFTLNQSIVNQTGSKWEAFIVKIADNDIAEPDSVGSLLHPVDAHFHPDKTGNYSPFTYTNPRPANAFNVTTTLVFGKGSVPPGGSFNIFNLLVHDVEVTNDVNGEELLRSFVITETPFTTPEPASVILLGAGAAAILGYRYRAGRQRGAKPQSVNV